MDMPDFKHDYQFLSWEAWEAFKSTLDMSDSRFRILVEECEALRERNTYWYLQYADQVMSQ